MKREHLEHVVAAAAEVSGEDEIVVVGSQAILGTHPEAPSELLTSIEADVYPRKNPSKAEEIDGALGDGSPFHETFGYYAHGVGPETADAPSGWERRLVSVEIPPRVGQDRATTALCLEPHDLVLAKCAAGRDRDWDYVRAALRAGIVDFQELISRVDDLPIAADEGRAVRTMLVGLAKRLRLD